jgi:hypothetical protein
LTDGKYFLTGFEILAISDFDKPLLQQLTSNPK